MKNETERLKRELEDEELFLLFRWACTTRVPLPEESSYMKSKFFLGIATKVENEEWEIAAHAEPDP